MAIEDAEERARAIGFESWDLSRPHVYFAGEKKALDWVEKHGLILRSKSGAIIPMSPRHKFFMRPRTTRLRRYLLKGTSSVP